MKIKNTQFLPVIFFGLIIIFSCNKEDEETPCGEFYYAPVSYLDWFPYVSDVGDPTPTNSFIIEEDTFILNKTNFQFLNESLDTQDWKMTYVQEKIRDNFYHDCPSYQEISFTIYRWQLETHINFGIVYRDTNFSSSPENTELYIPHISIMSCITSGENGQGILGGTCYPTVFDIHRYHDNDRVEKLTQFSTQFADYQSVFRVVVFNNSDHDLDYVFYIAKNHGIVAFENLGEMWSLME